MRCFAYSDALVNAPLEEIVLCQTKHHRFMKTANFFYTYFTLSP